jgi:hypothetical protein
MRGYLRTLGIALCAVGAAGCGSLQTAVPIRFDATSPASHLAPARFGEGSLSNMDHQVDLVALIVSDLQRDHPSPWTFSNGGPPLQASSSDATSLGPNIVYLGGDSGDALDRLLPVVRVSTPNEEIHKNRKKYAGMWVRLAEPSGVGALPHFCMAKIRDIP